MFNLSDTFLDIFCQIKIIKNLTLTNNLNIKKIPEKVVLNSKIKNKIN